MELYDKLLLQLQEYIAPMQSNGHILAVLDCLVCFADNALRYNYKKPVLCMKGMSWSSKKAVTR